MGSKAVFEVGNSIIANISKGTASFFLRTLNIEEGMELSGDTRQL